MLLFDLKSMESPCLSWGSGISLLYEGQQYTTNGWAVEGLVDMYINLY